MKNLNFKSALVTGITGLLGSWLAEELYQSGIEISGIALDKSKNELLDSKKLTEFLKIDYFDISKEELVNNYFKENSPDIVIHLAAQTQVIDGDKKPTKTFDSNIKGTWNILENCRIHNIPVVVASSDKAYGKSEILPYKESHSLNGIFPYEVSKSITDLLVNTYYSTYKLNVTALRCGNIYGGGDLNWDRLIPGLCRWFLNNEVPILRSDGSFKRDWVYVSDVANAYLSVANNLYTKQKKIAPAYNFAAKDYKTVIDVYSEVSKQINGKFIEPKFIIDSKNEIPDQYLDSSKIFNDLEIQSSVSFEEGLKRTISWYKTYFSNS